MATSQNGYKANDRSLVSLRQVPGTNVFLTVRKGAVGDLLLAFASEFDDHVEDIDNARGHLNDWGYAERPIRGSATELSNHASGTAIDLNADHHPLGKVNTFSPGQEATIHALLVKYEGCIRWGGDYRNRKDEMHFEVVASEASCTRVLQKIRNQTKGTIMSAEYDKLTKQIAGLPKAIAQAELDFPVPRTEFPVDIKYSRIPRVQLEVESHYFAHQAALNSTKTNELLGEVLAELKKMNGGS